MTDLANTTRPRDTIPALERVIEARRTARNTARRTMIDQHNGISCLLGRPMGRILADSLESLDENAGEIEYHLERLLERYVERAETEQENARRLEVERQILRDRLTQALDELDRRAKRSGKPAPSWVAMFRDDVDGAPF